MGETEADDLLKRGVVTVTDTEGRIVAFSPAGTTEFHSVFGVEAAGTLAAEPPLNPKCERLLVGQGTDTWDPLCQLPNGHEGSCSPLPGGTP